MHKNEILNNIEAIADRQGLTDDDIAELSKSLEMLQLYEDTSSEDTSSDEYLEMIDIFPALQTYKSEHSLINLKKLCLEISEFLLSIYASTHNAEERQVYFDMLNKLIN